MSKTYSKADLEKQAEKVFKTYPRAKKVFATSDGQFFLSKNRANLHAGAKGNVIEIQNDKISDDNSEDKGSKTTNAKDLIEAAAKLSTVQEVETAKKAETEGKNRSTVIAAYDDRIQELKGDN